MQNVFGLCIVLNIFHTINPDFLVEPMSVVIKPCCFVMPPLTTGVVRGFPSFRDRSSIANSYG